jgi:hypothetical protein
MTVDQLSHAIVSAFLQGGEQFVEGTLAAALPLLWLLVLALHLARPYMVRTTQKFSLRLGADIWWVLYIGIRDVMIAMVAILSLMYLYPDVLVANSLPIGGSLAAAAVFGALLVKLVADGDDDPRAFKLVSTLLAIGSALYIVPTLLGVQLTAVHWGPFWDRAASVLATNTDTGLAVALCWVSIALIGVMSMAAVWYNLRLPAEASRQAVGRGRVGAR